MLNSNKRIDREIKVTSDDLREIRRDLNEINNKIDQLGKEMQIFAKKNDVDTLQKYVDLWEPIKFVTQNQVEQIVKDIISDNK